MKTLFEKDTDRLSLKLQAEADAIKLFIDCAPIAGTAPSPPVTRDELLALIESGLRVRDLDNAVLDDVLKYINRGESVSERRIKKGREPETGDCGRLLLILKKFTGKGEMHEDEKGHVAFASMHLFDNVRSGQIVARIYPPKPGKDGVDIFDKAIPAKPGMPVKVKVDKSLRIEEPASSAENFQRIVAMSDGYLTEESGELQLHEDLHINGDIDFHYGNIDFIGKVFISGDVHPDFEIIARKGIVIQGGVQESRLRSPDGEIEIKGFAFGGKHGSIVCGQSLIGTVMHEVAAEVVGPIVITKEAIDCTLRTQSSISMPKARLVGGRAMCVCGVEAKEIGNKAGQETCITLANSVEVGTEYGEILVQIANHEQAIKLIELHLGPYAQNTARLQLLAPSHRARMEALLHKRKDVEASRLRLLAKKMSLLDGGKGNAVQRVDFYEALYPGVHIISGDHSFVPKEMLKGPGTVEFNDLTKEFVVSELKPLECNVGGVPNTKPVQPPQQDEGGKHGK